MAEITLVEAVRQAMDEELARDEDVSSLARTLVCGVVFFVPRWACLINMDPIG